MEEDNSLVGYIDNDWARSINDRKSTSEYVLFCLGSKVLLWSSKKQNIVALSSVEAEYISTTSVAYEVV